MTTPRLRGASVASLRRLADTVYSERVRAEAAWKAYDEAVGRNEMAKAETMRVRAEYHERTCNLIIGACPEVRKLLP